MTGKNQMSESYLTGALLAVVGGYLDAYTYSCRGHVFANAQTGNIVLMGINAAAGEWRQVLYYLLPITAFVLGTFVADAVKSRYRQSEHLHWRQMIIALEIIILSIVAYIPQGNTDMLANILISFVCSLQVETFRKMNGNSFATTMCTGNLRSAAELLFRFRQTGDKTALSSSLQYFGIILFFIIGAITGFVITNILLIKSVLFACLGLIAVFIIMFSKQQRTSK